MPTPNLFLLYVNDPPASAGFYEQLLGIAPVANGPTYVAFQFDSGVTLSRWSKSAKDFVSGGSGPLSEVAFMVDNEDEVRALHDRWRDAGVTIEQPLKQAVFGLTFVATDPDGHRIRVCIPDKR